MIAESLDYCYKVTGKTLKISNQNVSTYPMKQNKM